MDVYVIVDETESCITGFRGINIISVYMHEWTAEHALKQIAEEKNGRYRSIGNRSYVIFHDDDVVTANSISHAVSIHKAKFS